MQLGSDEVDLRVHRSKETVLATTFQLLSEKGLAGVTVDAVARRSGVAKTTIYRHWPSREALLLDACAQVGPQFDIPDTGSLQGDLASLTERFLEHLVSGPAAAILPSVLDAAERDADLAALQAAAHTKLTEAFRTVGSRAQRRGEFHRPPDPSHLAALVLGPLFYRRWFSHEPLSKGFVKMVLDNAVGIATAKRGQ
ncbi:MAG: TetR/AcrR family transcriptional regulator [Mycobacterium sp.]|nr:TetR/AcrR family transcriptional regulator [Mycobacterium sp.]